MDIDAAISHLESLGLYVDRHVPGGMADHQANGGLTIARELPDDGELAELVDACFVFRLRDGWVYRNWNGIGGRAPDDVHIEDLSLAAAIQYAEHFYFGAPLVIDGWLFPTNRHPEWNVERLRASFAAAQTLSHPAWRKLRGERHAASKSLDDAHRFLLKFREIESVEPRDGQRLWMRNDLAEMFVVRNR